jgi:hypothetical protein
MVVHTCNSSYIGSRDRKIAILAFVGKKCKAFSEK